MYQGPELTQIDGKYFKNEAVEKCKEELRKLALMVTLGLETRMTPCQQLMFELFDQDISE